MSPEAQRIAIAEALGIRDIKRTLFLNQGYDLAGFVGERPVRIPDYLNDLNAMHEAEKILTPDYQTLRYLDHLGWVCRRDGPEVPWLKCPFATAAQRAESLLYVLGKWEEVAS